MQLLSDIRTAANVFKQIRQARKTGADVEVRHITQIPVLKGAPSFLDTVEGCALANLDYAIFEKAGAAFKELNYNIKRQLSFSPQNGEFVERAMLWRKILYKSLSGKQRYKAMKAILDNYIRIKEMR